jgi:regulator of sigma E protease
VVSGAAVQVGQEAPQEVRSFEHLRWLLTQAALEKQDARISWQRAPATGCKRRTCPCPHCRAPCLMPVWALRSVQAPWTPAQVERVMDAGAAAAAGLQPGDVVRRLSACRWWMASSCAS